MVSKQEQVVKRQDGYITWYFSSSPIMGADAIAAFDHSSPSQCEQFRASELSLELQDILKTSYAHAVACQASKNVCSIYPLVMRLQCSGK